MMDHLLREHAPITASAWTMLDEEAAERLTVALGARRLVDFSGPHGWAHSATALGRTETISTGPAPGVTARRRMVLPLAELRVAFRVSREELRDHARGAPDVDLDELDRGALQLATAENVAVFHGWEQAGMVGIVEASPHESIQHSGQFETYPRCAARAVQLLRQAGVNGPYALALGPEDYTGVIETSERGGYPLMEHLDKILDGPIVWTPGVRGGVVVSARGGDFLFESGQDLSLGYDHHDAEAVHLYLEETFSFRVATPEAAVWIRRE